MRPNVVLAGWLALASLQATSAPFDNNSDHDLGKRQNDTSNVVVAPGPTPGSSAPGAPASPSPAPGGSAGSGSSAAGEQPSSPPTAPDQPSTPPAAPAEPTPSSASPADPSPISPSSPSPGPSSGAGGGTSVTPADPNPSAQSSSAEPTPSFVGSDVVPPAASSGGSDGSIFSVAAFGTDTTTTPPGSTAASSSGNGDLVLPSSRSEVGSAPPSAYSTPGPAAKSASPSSPPPLTPTFGVSGSDVDNSCTTSSGLKGAKGPAGCFADKGQKCSVSDGIPGEITDNGVCSPSIGVGASCTLSDGTKGTAQLQGLGTSLSCIGANLGEGTPCSLPFSITGSLGSDGKTCRPPKTLPPAGDVCPVPGFSGLGTMQSDGQTCLPPIQSGTDNTGGGGTTNSAGDTRSLCAVNGNPGVLVNGRCEARLSNPGDSCYRGGGGTYLSNALPDGIFAQDGKACLIVNDSCSENGVQGRWSPNYQCMVPPPTTGTPTTSGDPCQRDGMWGGRWDAASKACILPGDPCSSGDKIYAPNVVDCIPRPAAGTACKTAQGFAGKYNDQARCEAIIRPGARTPCLSVYDMAGAVSLGSNTTLCQIPPNPDIPEGILQQIRVGSYCQNGRDAGVVDTDINCIVLQRSSGLNDVPRSTPGNPHNDISVIKTVEHKGTAKWIPGVATAGAVIIAALVLGLLAWKCGWLSACGRKKNRTTYGPGEGILEDEGPDDRQPTLTSASGIYTGTYSDYAPTSTANTTNPPMSTVGRQLSIVSANTGPSMDPYADTHYHTLNAAWNQPPSYARTAAGSVSAHHPGSPPIDGSSPPNSPPFQPHQPLLSDDSNTSVLSSYFDVPSRTERGPSPPYDDPRNPFR